VIKGVALLDTMGNEIFDLEVYDFAVATVKRLIFASILFNKQKIVPPFELATFFFDKFYRQ
jgi:hypothetical protein